MISINEVLEKDLKKKCTKMQPGIVKVSTEKYAHAD